MIKNNKGFAVTEVLILSTVIIGVLIFMYSQFKNINRSYQYSFKYDTVGGMYLANNILNFINDDNYDKLVEETNKKIEKYIDITNCDIELFKSSGYCNMLFEKSQVEQVIFTEENVKELRKNSQNFSQDLKNYINQIKTTNEKNDYRIIIKYKDGTFATMRFNKGNSYVEDGLIAYLDGINNTGNGHSNDTQIWKDLSNHGNDATLYNNPTWSNNSLTFDGQTNYGRLENTINMPFPNGASIEVRVNVLSFAGIASDDTIEFFSNWEGAGIGIKMRANRVFRAGFYDTKWRSVENSNPSNLNEYYTITLTYDNTTQNLYIDGILVDKVTYNDSTSIKQTPAPFGIACNPSSSSTVILDNYANVEFQNVLIYDRALTENEVMRNYQADQMRY